MGEDGLSSEHLTVWNGKQRLLHAAHAAGEDEPIRWPSDLSAIALIQNGPDSLLQHQWLR